MIGIILSITAFLILFILLIYKNRQLKRQLAEAYRELVEDRELIFDLRKYTDEKLIDLESKIRTTAESKK